MKFELDLSRVKNHKRKRHIPQPVEVKEIDPDKFVEYEEAIGFGDETISMTVSTAIVGLGIAFGVGMLCGYSTGFKLGKTVGQAIGMSASYAQVARMAVRI